MLVKVATSHEQIPQTDDPEVRDFDEQGEVLAELSGERIVLHDRIYFEEGSAVILAQSNRVLTAVLNILATHLEVQHLLIEGHTNHRGEFAFNLELSEKRAQAVMDWLVERGINPYRLVCKGYGSHRPIVPPSHPKAIEINRRVEFTILRPDP